MGVRAALLVLLAASAAACEAEPSASSSFAPPTPAASERLPERFGIGRAATAAEVARLDVDVMPDGRGLPAGSGTVEQGAAVYAAKCAACHGVEGEGTPAGVALVGRGDPFADAPAGEVVRAVGNYWSHATTLFDYVRRAMPMDRPGSLSDAEVYALTAYLLNRNGIVPPDAVMDAGALPRVRMPARERFVPDDREGSTQVR
jgi:mono/diheme cytochrome c family protein